MSDEPHPFATAFVMGTIAVTLRVTGKVTFVSVGEVATRVLWQKRDRDIVTP